MPYQNQKVKSRQVVTPNTQTQDLGTVSEVPMGDWVAGTQYQKLNLVRYSGATYIALKGSQGVEPTVTTGWQQVWQVVVYDGRGVSSTSIDYQAGTSNVDLPTGQWVDNIPNVPQGQYLWTRTILNYTDGTQTTSYTVSLQVLGFTQQDRYDIERIADAIPSSATAENPLATQDFVNSSINNMAAFYIESNAQGDAWQTRASLLNASTFYNAGQVRVPTTNDYATVLADESQPKGVDGSYPTTRYSYQGGTYPNGQWGFQYVVNNTSLTQAQVNAINSGITKELVVEITSAATNINNKIDKITSGNKIYATLSGAQISLNYSTYGTTSSYANYIPQRNATGNITVPISPSALSDAAAKYYVDLKTQPVYVQVETGDDEQPLSSEALKSLTADLRATVRFNDTENEQVVEYRYAGYDNNTHQYIYSAVLYDVIKNSQNPQIMLLNPNTGEFSVGLTPRTSHIHQISMTISSSYKLWILVPVFGVAITEPTLTLTQLKNLLVQAGATSEGTALPCTGYYSSNTPVVAIWNPSSAIFIKTSTGSTYTPNDSNIGIINNRRIF